MGETTNPKKDFMIEQEWKEHFELIEQKIKYYLELIGILPKEKDGLSSLVTKLDNFKIILKSLGNNGNLNPEKMNCYLELIEILLKKDPENPESFENFPGQISKIETILKSLLE
jgi:hypothetical protein